jgi:nicotinamide-nucleotide amidase
LERRLMARRPHLLARRVLDLCRARGLLVATAESCTGGLVAGALTDIASSSDVVDCGFVTYSNAAKQSLLAVSALTLNRHGAVSEETAAAMAKGALKNSQADIAVAITGIAGPGGGSKQKPVGLVHFAAAARDGGIVARRRLYGAIGRGRVRERSVAEALSLLALLAKRTKSRHKKSR